jgi:hypothetical protein
MARTTSDNPTYVQCREGFVAIVDGEERFARACEIYKSDHPIVRHWSELFADLGDLPDTPRYIPPDARVA